ncbi:hypothetical protein E5161_09775 [Cohnella pontilimi]|uniref:Uncharacterized protein n=1 Tax=Cohnella pontilimi TaxID=2564100 RepID=A0A4U0FC80_9BACL|nr:hypothetical protein E5161_09775 [Cohnella pontilimi]
MWFGNRFPKTFPNPPRIC